LHCFVLFVYFFVLSLYTSAVVMLPSLVMLQYYIPLLYQLPSVMGDSCGEEQKKMDRAYLKGLLLFNCQGKQIDRFVNDSVSRMERKDYSVL